MPILDDILDRARAHLRRIALPESNDERVLKGAARLARERIVERGMRRLTRFLEGVYRHHGPQGVFARTWPTGSTVLWVAVFLAAFLILYYL